MKEQRKSAFNSTLKSYLLKRDDILRQVLCLVFEFQSCHISHLYIQSTHTIQQFSTILPVAAVVCSPEYPRYPLDGTMTPEWPVPVPASPQTHAVLSDTPDGPAPAPWPYSLHSAKHKTVCITQK